MELDYLPEATDEGHMEPNQDVIDIWKSLQKETQYNHLFEIGLNAGHSAAINLELFPDVKVTSLDIGRHDYTEIAGEILKKRFAGRFDYIICHSHAYHQRVRSGKYKMPSVDAVFVDGSHDWVQILSDISMAKLFGVKDVFIDDTNDLHDWSRKVHNVCKRFEELEVFTLVKHYKYSPDQQLSHYRF